MASCTAYIFEEDFSRLTKREVLHAYAGQQLKGGSLFGQWTSTGNPVIHFAMPYNASQSERDKMREDLYFKFRICYIGEWRPLRAHGGNDCHEMKARGAPTRFLVLDVSKEAIVPFLFEHQASKGRGHLERLSGKNPFNKTGVLERPVPVGNYNPQRYDRYHVQSSATEQSTWSPARPAEPQSQAAVTSGVQWYSSDQGNEKLKKVHKDFTEIAFGGKVDMSRDTATQNISLSFTDRGGKKWEVQFPASFPRTGAILIENPGTSTQRREPHGSSWSVDKAVANILSRIQKTSF